MQRRKIRRSKIDMGYVNFYDDNKTDKNLLITQVTRGKKNLSYCGNRGVSIAQGKT